MHCTAHRTVLCTYVYTHQHMVKKWMNEWDNLTLEKKKRIQIEITRTHSNSHMYVHACALTSSVSFRNISNFFVCWCCFYCSQNRRGESHTAEIREATIQIKQYVMHRWWRKLTRARQRYVERRMEKKEKEKTT